MAYVVKSTERLRPSAADTETKALLYLMNFRSDSDQIHYFVVDFLNDLTGMTKMSDKLWDLQSKGDKKPSPNAIGRELVTLYKNYVSEFEFSNYILFLGGISNTVRIDEKQTQFNISNIKDTALANIKKGLLDECKKKTYIAEEDISEEKIDKFLRQCFL
ncbi:hypothetical protein [Abyssisolibacter fermentans]|uniref:hypothetical protein n=1 Tax=Abyssisolibacter fermentans TaxID=1766203 RepID=UPI000A9C1F95|nr:hypothetical protein [Abyssisolibacter fermentans]